MTRNDGSEERKLSPPMELFAAANSGEGFYSFYSPVFERDGVERRYLIKGGPGTGKSSFLREVARQAESRGVAVEYYRCSSDPDSLDGLILDGRIALLDATAPHTAEPTLPGVRDEIVDLGRFWDADALGKRRNDVASYSALKSACYAKAYRFLSAAMEVEEANRALSEKYIWWEKMERAVRRLLRDVPAGEGFRAVPGLIEALGMKGKTRLSGLEAGAERIYAIEDAYGVGSAFLSLVIREAERRRWAIRVSYGTLCPTLPNGVLLEESGVCILPSPTEREPRSRVDMRRFLNPEGVRRIRNEYRRNARLSEGLVQAATDALSDAGAYHFELEKIYAACMDFDGEQKFIRDFCRDLLLRI